MKIYHYTSTIPSKKANAALLMGCYMILVLNKSPEEVNALFTQVTDFECFCDASSEKNAFELSLLSCFQGLDKAVKVGWYDLSSFNIREYESSSIIENGGYNWIIPNKVLAFLSPAFDYKGRDGVKPLTPEQYAPIFQSLGITTIIRLNKKIYEAERFIRHGFKFHEMYFIDGSVPSDKIIREFIKVLEVDDKVAVHCKAGLGRTGTLIGCYAMKHFGFTGLEFIAWARMCRPGSVLGPQQQFLLDMQETCWKWGENFRNGITEMEESKIVIDEENLSEADKFKAKYGDYKQAEKLVPHHEAEIREKRPNVIKIHKKQAFNKNK